MQQIKVLAQFDGPKVKPLLFNHGASRVKIEKINLVHNHLEGERRIFNFHVSNRTACYNLRFEPDILQWFLQDEDFSCVS
jgi:hypothetical protein